MATDFEMYAGDNKSLTFTVTTAAGVAVVVTDAAISWVLTTAPGATALITKTSTGTITISGSTVTVPLVEADTAALAGTYYYELEITDTSGNISTNQGRATIHKTAIA